jgi:hypothetical protein
MRVCIPEMIKRGGGGIVSMSSVQSLAGFKGWAAYAAAKGGINALTQQAAIDLAPAGIRVNAVAPGTIMTPLNEKVFREHPDPDALIATWNRAHPIGRFGEASEVAELVAFLASDRACLKTGDIVRVHGGLFVRGVLIVAADHPHPPRVRRDPGSGPGQALSPPGRGDGASPAPHRCVPAESSCCAASPQAAWVAAAEANDEGVR